MTEQVPSEQPDDPPEGLPEGLPEGEELEDGVPEEEGEPEPRRYPSTIGGAFYLLVLGVSGAGIFIAWREDWRLGIQIFAGALGFAALIRLVLPSKDAGMLEVRNRVFDVLLLASLCGLLVFLTLTIPDRSL